MLRSQFGHVLAIVATPAALRAVSRAVGGWECPALRLAGPAANGGSGERVSELIDTTEMYLKTIYELEEEGIVPLRARIADRLHQSGPTVSQTVARMERDGLLHVDADRHLELSELGRAHAIRVMRKHRLAERLLTDIVGLDWELVHDEACRWEHVISEEVEKRLVAILDNPTESPYGNPIPGLEELGVAAAPEQFRDGVAPLTTVVRTLPSHVQVKRLSEPIQTDPKLMATLRSAGVVPGQAVEAARTDEGVRIGPDDSGIELSTAVASHVFVRAG
jgi:DtxR family transcriptional regulator, Mn-dependent transcriptional regulator